jgi:hypothetical protein
VYMGIRRNVNVRGPSRTADLGPALVGDPYRATGPCAPAAQAPRPEAANGPASGTPGIRRPRTGEGDDRGRGRVRSAMVRGRQ